MWLGYHVNVIYIDGFSQLFTKGNFMFFMITLCKLTKQNDTTKLDLRLSNEIDFV